MSTAGIAEVEHALRSGWRFGGLHGAADGRGVHVLLLGPGATWRMERLAADAAGSVPSLTGAAPAATWDEREAADLHGLRFSGHEPLRPLVRHDPDPASWTVAVRGDDAYQVAVGPIHAGIIESGHFRFHVVGDRILHVDVRLFHKHRGLERAAAGASLDGGIAFAARACGACAVTNAVAYAQGCEAITGTAAPAGLARVRTILLELERVWSHLNDVAAVCAGVGMAPANTAFATLSDRARRVNAELTGHRLLFGAVRVGGSDVTAGAARVAAARDELAGIGEAARRAWRALLFNASFTDRLDGTGTLSAVDARALGATGPAARASGLREDARTASPRLAYGGFEPVLAEGGRGDVAARAEQRIVELDQALGILAELLDAPIAPVAAPPGTAPAEPVGVGIAEGPRGATSCVIEPAGGRVGRLRLRTGSYANWPLVAHAAAGELLPDFPLINKSFELCYACVDR